MLYITVEIRGTLDWKMETVNYRMIMTILTLPLATTNLKELYIFKCELGFTIFNVSHIQYILKHITEIFLPDKEPPDTPIR